MRKHVLYWLALGFIVIIGCQKETSFELGTTPAEGSLQADGSGDCLPKTVSGSYIAGTPLVPTASTITVSVIVTKTGSWEIGTDTVNGYYFRGTGTFTTLGPTNITLRGNGTPFAAGVNNFVVTYGTSICDIQVTVLPGGSGPATFTLAGAPGACSTPTIAGTYALGTPLNASNTVTLNVNVTVAGTYNVTTTATNGMTFSGTGTLATGAQTITLTGSGTPGPTSGATPINVTAGATTCNFTITVSSAGAFTLNGAPGACGTPTIAGTYTAGTALTGANTVTLNVNVTTAGAWSVTTAPATNGMIFSGSGTFAATGAATILLTGSGTPTNPGATNVSVTAGATTCTFTITVVGGGSAWVPNCSSVVIDGLYEDGTQLNASNLVDITVNVTSTGPYNISTTATNGMVFSASGTFAATGSTVITLVGSGTPINAGTFNIPVPGTTPCTFPLVVDVEPPIDWQFTVTNAPQTIYRGQTDASVLQPATPPLTGVVFGLAGSNSLGSDDFQLAVNDIDGTINAGDTYVSGATAAFAYTTAAGAGPYEANPTVTGVTMTVNVTSHNVATKTIMGTFSGTAKDAGGNIITVTTGTFRATYP